MRSLALFGVAVAINTAASSSFLYPNSRNSDAANSNTNKNYGIESHSELRLKRDVGFWDKYEPLGSGMWETFLYHEPA